VTATISCAICTSPIVGEPRMLDDVYKICAACDDEPVRTKRGPQIAYDVPERERIGPTLVAFASAANRVTGPRLLSWGRGGALAAKVSPGYVLVRVSRVAADGSPIDAKEARETLRSAAWFGELRHLGTDIRNHLFERPDAKAAARARAKAAGNPIAGIERHRR
jgi:hypothetical protein